MGSPGPVNALVELQGLVDGELDGGSSGAEVDTAGEVEIRRDSYAADFGEGAAEIRQADLVSCIARSEHAVETDTNLVEEGGRDHVGIAERDILALEALVECQIRRRLPSGGDLLREVVVVASV